MRPYFTRDRFGSPQFLAGLLLLAFLGQAGWLVHSELRSQAEMEPGEVHRIREGWRQIHGRGIAAAPVEDPTTGASSNFSLTDEEGYDTQRSPLLYLISAAPLLAWPHQLDRDSVYWGWLPRIPFLACGFFLGASLWYVARRLCGNVGGFIALTFYCFSPSLLQASALWHAEPDVFAAWGAFGTIFTTIAVGHTLYAPREVVLWNWRRIALLSIALAIAIGSQFSMVILVPLALPFLFYVAPVRKQAATVIWASACVLAFFLLFAVYSFDFHAFFHGMQHADFWGATWRGFAVPGVYKQVARQISRACPAMLFVLPVALVAYALWPRTRYFGNTAPLLMAVLFLLLGMAHPHLAGAGFLLAAMPFLFIFVSGVLADLLETRYRTLACAAVLGMMLAYAIWNVMSLARVPLG